MTQILLMPRSSDTLPRFEDEADGIDSAGRVDDDWSTGAPDAVLDVLGLVDFARPAHNLPVPPTRMLDRVWEVETVRRLLGSEGVRLLTLVAPGGVGKTRLALAAAQILLDAFPDGARFVHLAPLADSTRALSTIAAAIDSHPAEGRPS